MVKNRPVSAGVAGLIPELGRSPGGRYGNPLQYSYLENPMDREAWQAAVCGVTRSPTRLKQLSKHAVTIIRQLSETQEMDREKIKATCGLTFSQK